MAVEMGLWRADGDKLSGIAPTSIGLESQLEKPPLKPRRVTKVRSIEKVIEAHNRGMKRAKLSTR